MKENYFFKHDYNARTDPKLQNVLMEMGLMGVGLYWCVVEQLYEQGGELPLTSIKSIAFALHAEADDVLRLISDFGLFKKDRKKFWSDSVNRRIDDRESLSEKRRAAIQQRWNKNKRNTNVSDSDTKVLHEDKNCNTPQSTCAIQCNTIKIEDKDKIEDKESVYTRTYEEFFERFFRVENQLMLEKTCMDFGTDMATLKNIAQQITTEWNLTEQTHKDYNDASRHLLSLIQKRLQTKKVVKKVEQSSEQVSSGTWSVEEEQKRHQEFLDRKKNSVSREEYLRIKAQA